VADAVAEGRAILRDAKTKGMRAQVTIAVAFGCPFEGDVSVERIAEIAAELAHEQPVEIGLADTIGVGVPAQVLALFGALRSALGGAMPLRAHFHNTRNTGIANAFAALMADVDTLDASIGGIGGCPFAPKASGNIATEDLVYMLDRMKVTHDATLASLLDAANWLSGALKKPVPSMLSRAGGFP
jgi:hydroxymethylglutaryl-CoA lyase